MQLNELHDKPFEAAVGSLIGLQLETGSAVHRCEELQMIRHRYVSLSSVCRNDGVKVLREG